MHIAKRLLERMHNALLHNATLHAATAVTLEGELVRLFVGVGLEFKLRTVDYRTYSKRCADRADHTSTEMDIPVPTGLPVAAYFVSQY